MSIAIAGKLAKISENGTVITTSVDDRKKVFAIPSTQLLLDIFSCETFNYRGKIYVWTNYLIFVPLAQCSASEIVIFI